MGVRGRGRETSIVNEVSFVQCQSSVGCVPALCWAEVIGSGQ